MSKCISYEIWANHFLVINKKYSMLDEIIKAARNPVQIALLLILLTGIVFESKVSAVWSEWADTIVGKLVIVGVFLGLEYSYHWTLGFLWLLFALLIISPQMTRVMKEGFAMQASLGKTIEHFNDTSFIDKKKGKWFVEKLLKENPVAIKERGVNTYPVQD